MNEETEDWIMRRDLGMERARAKAERECGTNWIMRAAVFLKVYAQTIAQGQPFLLEDARALSVRHFAQPTNAKAWGPAAIHAVKCGWIRRCGYAPARSSNGSPKCQWQAV